MPAHCCLDLNIQHQDEIGTGLQSPLPYFTNDRARRACEQCTSTARAWITSSDVEMFGVMVGRKAIRDIRSHFLQSALFSFALNSISGAFLAMVSHQSNFITLPVRLRYDIRAYLEPLALKAHGTISKAEHGAIACIFSEPVKDRCAFCSSPARKRCGKCFTAFYCSEHHQSGHWKVHRVSCCVYQGQRKPIVFPPKRL